MKKLLLLLAILLVTDLYAQTARVQVIHNSADVLAQQVDVYINGALAIDDFTFRTATPFIDLPADSEISIAVAPATSTSVDDAIATFPFTLVANETYVVVADGIVSPTGYSPSQPFTLNVYPMGREAAEATGNTDILVHHGSTDAPTVDLVETGAGAGTVVDDISYGEFQGYLELPTNDYTIQVKDATGTVTVASYALPLAGLGLEGTAVTALASGFLNPSDNSNGPAFGIWVALPSGGELVALPNSTARVQVIHNSADAAAQQVDVYVNGTLAIDDFTFRTATPFIDLPADSEISIAVAPATSTSVDDAIATFPFTLTANESYVVVADGIVSSTGYSPVQPFTLNVYAMARETAAATDATDILIHHGSTDAPTVDVVETGAGAGTVVDDISYGEFQGYLELQVDDYIIDVRDASGVTTVATYALPLNTLSLDGVALAALASGFLNPSNNSDGPSFGIWVALPTGGALIPLPVIPLSINEFNLDTFKIFPNPTSNFLNFVGLNLNGAELTIVDIQGRKLNTNSYKINNDRIDVSKLSSGIYNVIIIDSQKNSIVKKFIKQ